MFRREIGSTCNDRCYKLVVFGLFDDELSIDETRNMADQLIATPRPADRFETKPSFPQLTSCVRIHVSFIGKRSWLLFHKLKSEGKWLRDDVEGWKNNAEYQYMESVVEIYKL